MTMKLRIGTRGSKLALWQANFVKSSLLSIYPSLEVEIAIIKTSGDINLKDNLSLIGGKGVFVKEIEEALLADEIDIAVHSLKDVPSVLPDGLCIGSVMKRHNPFDAFISKSSLSIEKLPPDSVVATGSERRKYQLLNSYPHLKVVPIRGNVDTRLKKLHSENLDGIVLAAAGLERLGLDYQITQVFDSVVMVPSPCQGIIGIECRSGDSEILKHINNLKDRNTDLCATVERTFLKTFGGDCTVPLGCYSFIEGSEIKAVSVFIDIKKNGIYKRNSKADINNVGDLGRSLAIELKKDIERKGGLKSPQ